MTAQKTKRLYDRWNLLHVWGGICFGNYGFYGHTGQDWDLVERALREPSSLFYIGDSWFGLVVVTVVMYAIGIGLSFLLIKKVHLENLSKAQKITVACLAFFAYWAIGHLLFSVADALL